MIWLSQAFYIDKIANLAISKQPDAISMSKDELFLYDGMTLSGQISLYQQKVRSLIYAAVITQPNIVFVVSRLACYLINPGSIY